MQRGAINKLLIALLVLAGLGLETGYGWVKGDRKYRREITLSPATTSANYQLLVTLATTNFNYSHATTNGSDLLFTDSTNGALDHWVEKWNTSGESKLWVKVATSDTSTIRLYYGNQATNGGTAASNVFVRVVGDTSQSLKGAWNFDEADGNFSYDTSGNSITGTNTGAAVTNGKFGNARYYTGIPAGSPGASYTKMGIAQPLNQTTNDFTLEAWIKTPGSTSATAAVMAKFVSYPLWHMAVSGTKLGARIGSTGASNYIFGANGTSVTNDTWTHVVVVFDRDSTMKRYVNGAADGTDVNISAIQNQSVSNNLEFCVGTTDTAGNYNYYRGAIDEPKVYNVALTPDEISDLYTYYGYTTTNYPGRVLVRQYAAPEPSVTDLGAEENLFPKITIVSTF